MFNLYTTRDLAYLTLSEMIMNNIFYDVLLQRIPALNVALNIRYSALKYGRYGECSTCYRWVHMSPSSERSEWIVFSQDS